MIEEKLKESINYIIEFLLHVENPQKYASKIGYTDDSSLFAKYDLVIIPSGFFSPKKYGTQNSMPKLPLQDFNGTPLLFGEARVEKKGDTVICYADIVASSFYLLSRYEEIIFRQKRDKHGRFLAKYSVVKDFLHRPIVDEYGQILRKLLRENGIPIDKPKQEIKKVYLTHDVDKLSHYKNIRSVIGAVVRFYKKPKLTYQALKTFFGKIENDPWFTFDYFLDFTKKIAKKQNVENIFFIKSAGGKQQEDLPLQNIKDKYYQQLFALAKKENYTIGLHPSYQAGKTPHLIKEEKQLLDKTIEKKTNYVRSHYLTSREPEDMRELIQCGFTDDFTMGYADKAGFRLGTCRATKWIDPISMQVSSLTLHPLTVMDNTLSDKQYMNLTEQEAFDYVAHLIKQTQKHNGDLTLLWHNTSVEKNNNQYHRRLYHKFEDLLLYFA